MAVRMMRRFALTLLLLAAPSLLFALPAQVRVSLTAFSGAGSLTVTCAGGFFVTNTSDNSVAAHVEAGSTAQVTAEANSASVSVGELTYHLNSAFALKPDSPDQPLTIKTPTGKSRSYRGDIEIQPCKNGLRAYNVVDVESYLRGVVPLEMPSSYPEEALKAQAVAARTYVCMAAQRFKALGRDLCDGSHCQQYAGVSGEKPRCDKAVLDTCGMVLTCSGSLASTMYCADSGGSTAGYCDYYPGAPFPYLACVPDPSETEHIVWRASLPAATVAQRLTKSGFAAKAPFTTVSITKMDAAGRAIEVEFATVDAKTAVPAHKLRAALGNDVIKSTAFKVNLTDDGKLEFEGTGYGHGFGMSQRGAKAMASPPNNRTFQQILAHYYPGTEIVAVESVTDKPAKRPSGSANADRRSSAASPAP